MFARQLRVFFPVLVSFVLNLLFCFRTTDWQAGCLLIELLAAIPIVTPRHHRRYAYRHTDRNSLRYGCRRSQFTICQSCFTDDVLFSIYLLLAAYRATRTERIFIVFARTWLRYVWVSAIANPSVVCLSVVCNVRAYYSAGWTFRQYGFVILYLSHRLTSIQNFTEIVPEEPLRRGR